MESNELQNILNAYQQQLNEAKLLNMQSWVLNRKCFEDLQLMKSQERLKSLIPIKSMILFLGVVWVAFVGYLFVHSLHWQTIFFAISSGAILAFNLWAIVAYVKHIALIKKVNPAQTVVETQKTISNLQLSTIRFTRLLFLQAPFYCIFWWNFQMIKDSPMSFWFISVPIALLFTAASVWLYRNLKIENRNKKWFHLIFNSPEWNRLTQANEMIEEIEEMNKENA